ncbi:hypothetical protein PRVXH_001306 [Proteinivorax hydrogeniformans]|uniref:Uncharacterized protein n=1 Tax=Proteinivorax hydrogeniformans TaxID=1826727 RepID=A0AAU8HX42_9FIRM
MTVFRQKDIKCEGVNVGELTAEEIKRSKIIHMFECGHSIEEINLIYDRHFYTLYWLRQIAKLRKRKTNDKLN